MIDILIPLGDGSRWENNELRYALRSIERHAKGLGRVFVIGDPPGFLSDEVVFIPHIEPGINKEARIAEKVLWVCKHTDISEEFLFANDDHVFLRDVDVRAYPYRHKGPLRTRRTGGYSRSILETRRALTEQGCATWNFDSHVPIRYRKEDFVFLEGWWQRSATLAHGLVVKSTYCNALGISGEYQADCKLRFPRGADDVVRAVDGRDVFSFDDSAIPRGVQDFLQERFPEPSRYEE